MFWRESIDVIIIEPTINGIIKIKILVAIFVIVQFQIIQVILNRLLCNLRSDNLDSKVSISEKNDPAKYFFGFK